MLLHVHMLEDVYPQHINMDQSQPLLGREDKNASLADWTIIERVTAG